VSDLLFLAIIAVFLLATAGLDTALPAFNEVVNMNILYLVSGIIAFALLVYLVIALLKPEWFK